jgi:hypothetical protein
MVGLLSFQISLKTTLAMQYIGLFGAAIATESPDCQKILFDRRQSQTPLPK